MLFDTLCKIAEKNPQMKNLPQMLRQAKLFIIDQPAHQFLKSSAPDPGWMDWAENTFTMPFPIVAVEDPASLVLFEDLEEDPVGVKSPRGYIEVLSTDAPLEAFDKKHFLPREYKLNWEQFCDGNALITVIVGVISDLVYNTIGGYYSSYMAVENVFGTSAKNGYKLTGVPLPKDMPSMIEAFGNNSSVALHELIKCSEPTNFILETSPKKVRNPNKSKKIPRSHERPQYTLLEPDKIRKIMGTTLPTPGTVGSPKRPHDRRAHTRTLRSSRFGDNQGKQVSVKASWVGPSEAQVGNKIYKVRLDL